MLIRNNPHPIHLFLRDKHEHSSRRPPKTSYYLDVNYFDSKQNLVKKSWPVTEEQYKSCTINDSLQVWTNDDSTVFCFMDDLDVHYENFFYCLGLMIIPFFSFGYNPPSAKGGKK